MNDRDNKNKLKKWMRIAIQRLRMSMKKILNRLTIMKIKRRLNPPSTLNMMKKYDKLKINKGCYQEE